MKFDGKKRGRIVLKKQIFKETHLSRLVSDFDCPWFYLQPECLAWAPLLNPVPFFWAHPQLPPCGFLPTFQNPTWISRQPQYCAWEKNKCLPVLGVDQLTHICLVYPWEVEILPQRWNQLRSPPLFPVKGEPFLSRQTEGVGSQRPQHPLPLQACPR